MSEMTQAPLTAETTSDKTTDELVRIDVDRGVAVITLARPDQLNALSVALVKQLRRALLEVGERGDVRAVVLAGEGRAFCAGLDLSEGIGDPDIADPVEGSARWMRISADIVWTMRTIPQPVITAVQGWAVGAGFAFAAASDVRFVGPQARFSAPFLKLGMSVGDLGLSWFLPRIVGMGRAGQVLYEAGVIDAKTAVEYGLASRISEDPLAEAVTFAERLASFPTYGVQASKELLNASASAGLREHLDAEARAQAIGGLTEAAQQAFAATLAATRRIESEE